MKKSRILIFASLSLLLAACGDEHKDKAVAPVPAPAPATAPAANAPVPAPEPAAEQPRESEAKPAAAKAVASPKAPAVEAAIKPEAKAPSKTPAQVKKPVDPVVKHPLPPVKLDLRLPKDMIHELDPDKPVVELEDKPLLPQMFGEKTGQSPFQVGGRLISREPNERETNDDSWHSDIRGAELQFKFRN
ncbi:translation initiation factor 2 [Pseudomonas sp. PDM18]|uniref:translation initiation factor 2 n=1 Tax=Pseudomonas sp. PDM18 TaxID=2769253 RepID=UPI001784827A|nr:translation initiation factor 2 [Pseudomonas sp. PDM18]MBD9678108.1 translation initiation factor 2 [Pseudomonas sp. PDM18]